MIDILLDNDQGKRDHIIKLKVGWYNTLQKIQKIIKEYCEKIKDTEEMDKFLNAYELLELNPEDKGNLKEPEKEMR